MARPNKRRCERVHFARRCAERLGFALSPETRNGIIRAIQTGEAEFLDKQSNRVSRWRVEILGQPCVVVYDKRTKELVTVLYEGVGSVA